MNLAEESLRKAAGARQQQAAADYSRGFSDGKNYAFQALHVSVSALSAEDQKTLAEILSKIPPPGAPVPIGQDAAIGAAAIAPGALAGGGANARQAVAEPSAVVSDVVLYHPLHPTQTAEGTYDTVEEPAVFNGGVTHDDALAALVVRAFPATDEKPASVNLLVFTDGGGIVHKQNVVNGTGLGQWSWS
jgi:hypothetical protein